MSAIRRASRRWEAGRFLGWGGSVSCWVSFGFGGCGGRMDVGGWVCPGVRRMRREWGGEGLLCVKVSCGFGEAGGEVGEAADEDRDTYFVEGERHFGSWSWSGFWLGSEERMEK